jgi:hypothetical protein
MDAEGHLIPLLTLIHDAVELLKAALNVVVGDERLLDGPEDLTGKTTAQSGLYTHPCQHSRTLATSRGRLTPDTPPPYWRVHEAPRIGPSASLCRVPIYSSPSTGS